MKSLHTTIRPGHRDLELRVKRLKTRVEFLENDMEHIMERVKGVAYLVISFLVLHSVIVYMLIKQMNTYLTTHPLAQTPRDVFVHIAAPLVTHAMGWRGMSVCDSPARAECVVMLTPHVVMNDMFPEFAAKQLSVCNMDTREIWIHEDRWLGNIPNQSQLPLPAYRSYVLHHEIGHALGLAHAKHSSGPSPIMIQQTLGIGDHTPYPFPLEHEKDTVRNVT